MAAPLVERSGAEGCEEKQLINGAATDHFPYLTRFLLPSPFPWSPFSLHNMIFSTIFDLEIGPALISRIEKNDERSRDRNFITAKIRPEKYYLMETHILIVIFFQLFFRVFS